MGKPVSKEEFFKQLDEEQAEYKAEKEIHDMEARKSLTDHEHDFRLLSGNRGECNCGWGIYLDAKDTIREGKLYREDTLII